MKNFFKIILCWALSTIIIGIIGSVTVHAGAFITNNILWPPKGAIHISIEERYLVDELFQKILVVGIITGVVMLETANWCVDYMSDILDRIWK